jgi:hypothetical protein
MVGKIGQSPLMVYLPIPPVSKEKPVSENAASRPVMEPSRSVGINHQYTSLLEKT